MFHFAMKVIRLDLRFKQLSTRRKLFYKNFEIQSTFIYFGISKWFFLNH